MSQSRVILEDLKPTIDCGAFPIRKVPGEKVQVRINAFADGHDFIRVELLFRQKDKRKWQWTAMSHQGNDEYTADFKIEHQKDYEFSARAWIDHPLNWLFGTRKKWKAGQDIASELSEAPLFLEDCLLIARSDAHSKIKDWKDIFLEPGVTEEKIQLLESDPLEDLFNSVPSRKHASYYQQINLVQVERTKALFSAWYEFFPRSAAKGGRHGTFNDCIQLLPRIQELGFDVIYLPPIHPIGKVNRKGKNNSTTALPEDVGSCWGIGSEEGGHRATHPQLGTLEEYQKLLQEAQKKGMEIAFDFAIQCAPDHPWVNEYPQWFKWRPDGSIQYAENPPKKYQDILPIDFECEDWENLWNELVDVVKFWCDLGVTIFRVDNPHTKPFDFWAFLIREVQKDFPNTLFLAEAFTKPKVMHRLTKIGFSQSVTYFTWRNYKHELIEYMEELTQGPGKDYFRPNFWVTTPDINPFNLQEENLPMFKIRYFLAATLSPSYGIYGPAFELMDCAPVEGKEEFLNSEKYEIREWNWEERNELTTLMTQVNHIRKQHPAFQHLHNYKYLPCENDALFTFYKYDHQNQEHFILCINLDPNQRQSGWVQAPLGDLGKTEGYVLHLEDILDGRTYEWSKEWNYISLAPEQTFHLFKVLNV